MLVANMQLRAPEVLEGGPKYLFPSLLSLLVADLQNVAHEGGVPLAVRQLVGIHITNGANDALG